MGIDHLDAVVQHGAFDIGEVDVLDLANGRSGIARGPHDFRCGGRGCARRSCCGLAIGLALARQDGLAVDRAGQPALHGGLDLIRRHGGKALQLVLVVIRITGIELTFSQDRGLAIGLFQTLDGARGILGDDAVDLVLGRAFRHKAVEGGIHPGGHGLMILARLDHGRIGEHAHALEG